MIYESALCVRDAADRLWHILPRWNTSWKCSVEGRRRPVAWRLQSRQWEVYSAASTSSKCRMQQCNSCMPPFNTTSSSLNKYVKTWQSVTEAENVVILKVRHLGPFAWTSRELSLDSPSPIIGCQSLVAIISKCYLWPEPDSRSPFSSNRQHLSYNGCLEVRTEIQAFISMWQPRSWISKIWQIYM